MKFCALGVGENGSVSDKSKITTMTLQEDPWSNACGLYKWDVGISYAYIVMFWMCLDDLFLDIMQQVSAFWRDTLGGKRILDWIMTSLKSCVAGRRPDNIVQKERENY